MRLCFDAASAMASTPASPESTAQVSLRADCVISGNSSGARRFPGLGILAPDASFGDIMLTGLSFGFATGAVDEQIQRSFGPAIQQAHVQCFLTST